MIAGRSIWVASVSEALAIVKQNWETIVAVAAELAKAPDEMLDGDAVREAVRSAEPATRL